MGLESFYLGQAYNIRGLFFERFSRIVNNTAGFHEVLNGKGRSKASRARGWQNVVGSGDIVSDRLRCVMSQEHGSGIADLAQILKGIFDLEFEVFRRDPIGQGNGLRNITNGENGPEPCQGFPGNIPAGQCCQLPVDLTGNGPGNISRIRHQNSRREHIVLGLGKHIGCRKFRIGAFIGNNQNFTGTGNHIDANRTGDNFFGERDIDISGTGDYIYPGNRFGAIGQSRYRPGAPNFVDLGYAHFSGSHQQMRIDLTRWS